MTNAINNMGQSNPIASNLSPTTTQGTGNAAPAPVRVYAPAPDGKVDGAPLDIPFPEPKQESHKMPSPPAPNPVHSIVPDSNGKVDLPSSNAAPTEASRWGQQERAAFGPWPQDAGSQHAAKF
ncbi:hypothetical protein SAMN05444172_3394 [Burkholderia sp. GAS332]|nr:hypothetical protein SAMN05444172_3394 [Burkholderia sp. GAS332]